MCDPVTGTLAAIGAVAGVAGTVSSAMSSRAAGNYNAKLSANQAEQEIAAGNYEADRGKEAARRRLAAQKVSYAASGVAADSGSPLEVAAEDTKQAALDDMVIRFNARTRARGLRGEAAGSRMSGRNAQIGAAVQGGSTLATQGANLYLAYHRP